ncbi:MAG: HmuY family protein [Cyclobacteriaceae bacterium]
MSISKSIFSSILIAGIVGSLVSCSDDDPTAIPIPAITISNLEADPATGFDPMTGQPQGTTGKFKLFSFESGGVVANSDSATSNWDLGFRGTTIIVNGGTSGPGTAQAQVLTGIFDELLEAPETGYFFDSAPTYAIPTGSGNGWYNATGGGPTSPTVVTPIAGRVIVVKTANGRYAKVEILSYYKDAPASPTGTEPARYYTFRYVYQPNDTRKFEN